MLSINTVIDFIDNRKTGTGLAQWTRNQIGQYVIEQVKQHRIRIVDNGHTVLGVVVFDPTFRYGFYVDQIWGSEAMPGFLKILRQEYPEVTEILGWRTNKLVTFKLKTLEKIYGRRSSSTNTVRVN